MRLITGGSVGGLTTFQGPPGSNRCLPAHLCLHTHSENHQLRPAWLLDLGHSDRGFYKTESCFYVVCWVEVECSTQSNSEPGKQQQQEQKQPFSHKWPAFATNSDQLFLLSDAFWRDVFSFRYYWHYYCFQFEIREANLTSLPFQTLVDSIQFSVFFFAFLE